jgi:hypothetical protein
MFANLLLCWQLCPSVIQSLKFQTLFFKYKVIGGLIFIHWYTSENV